MRVPVWNSFGGRIAPLDTFQTAKCGTQVLVASDLRIQTLDIYITYVLHTAQHGKRQTCARGADIAKEVRIDKRERWLYKLSKVPRVAQLSQ